MKIKFKVQQFQSEAVESVVQIFAGQPYQERTSYIRDLGADDVKTQSSLFEGEDDADPRLGFGNAPVALTQDQLLKNIREIQSRNNINLDTECKKPLGACSLDVEMETGTGKTYVYIKTIFELNKRFGWNKFIVVVPSIAIREGVKKSFEMTTDHFMEHYGKRARFFIYNSGNLSDLDQFSSDAKINVMIINIQAFNARGADARRIYEELDSFGSRKPIDIIAANRPILILDEPQKMGGDKTQNALKEFRPLFTLNYSATHRVEHNMVYVLDAVDAYHQRLVKKIEVKGFELENLRGTGSYLYLADIVLSSGRPPEARIELEIRRKEGVKREIRLVRIGDDLYRTSKEMEQYKGYTVNEIDPLHGIVTFTNGEKIARGEVRGNVTESDMRRVQIRETILSHFEKEEKLFSQGIKTLSLFFIDEVAHYRQYDENGNERNGEFGNIFEEEYQNILNENLTLFDEPYQLYLRKIASEQTHAGYFSIDKKGHKINSSTKRGSSESDDISAYDLILKNKERLLSLEEPVRFIFSHSALREGWDNPNVFQICTLKHGGSDSTTKRQEVGRGLRLCIDQHGERMDADRCGDDVQSLNKLTVIASEGYSSFVKDLQRGIGETLYSRPKTASIDYFMGKIIPLEGRQIAITDKQATKIYHYLVRENYVDDDGKITEKYYDDCENKNFAPMKEDLVPIADQIHRLIQSIENPNILTDMISDGNQTKIRDNKLNKENFEKFRELWECISPKYAYRVKFDSQELITKSVESLNKHLTSVTQLCYTLEIGIQSDQIDGEQVQRGESFERTKTSHQRLNKTSVSSVKYDLIGKIATGTKLLRNTVAEILSKIAPSVFALYPLNPEEFISRAIQYINEEKATMVVEHISYNKTDQSYESDIFTMEKGGDYTRAWHSGKSIQDYFFTDGTAEMSVERRFAKDLDTAAEVNVYARLPRGFSIPTPVGNYSPDWAIVFHRGKVKHIFFVAETKGSMESMQLRPIEQAKIKCAKRLFNSISTKNVVYHEVKDYKSLLEIVELIPQ